MKASKVNLLMTGGGAPGGPGIIKCFQTDSRINLFVGDMDSGASGKHLTRNFILLPSADDPDFIDKILSIAIDNKINVIFPLVTKELFRFSESIKVFEDNGISVVVSDNKSLMIANDKIALYKHLDKKGISLPSFREVNTVKALNKAVFDLGYPKKQVVIKPGVSNGSRGVRILSEEIDQYDLMFNYKPNHLYTNLSELNNILLNKPIPPMLVSEYLPGPELTIDSIIDKDGEILTLLIRSRDKMNNGISTAGRFIHSPEVEEYCSSILKSMNLFGPIGIQLKEVNNSFKVIEMNPRIQGTSVAALGLGINLPVLSISSLLGWKVDLSPNKSGIGFSRFYDEVYFAVD